MASRTANCASLMPNPAVCKQSAYLLAHRVLTANLRALPKDPMPRPREQTAATECAVGHRLLSGRGQMNCLGRSWQGDIGAVPELGGRGASKMSCRGIASSDGGSGYRSRRQAALRS